MSDPVLIEISLGLDEPATEAESATLEVSRFIAAQIGEEVEDLCQYAGTDATRRRHLIDLRLIYGFKMFSGCGARDLKGWLEREAETARSNENLVRRFVEDCRRTQTILPGVSVIERLCADAVVAAERRIESRIADRLDDTMKGRLDDLLTEMVDDTISRFIWLRQFEVGKNSAGTSRLLDRLEFLQGIGLSPDILDGLPPHRVTQLRRQGERYFADGLRDITSDRRLAILAVCAVEWHAAIADVVVETHDRAAIVLEPMAHQWLAGQDLAGCEEIVRCAHRGCKICSARYALLLQKSGRCPSGSQGG